MLNVFRRFLLWVKGLFQNIYSKEKIQSQPKIRVEKKDNEIDDRPVSIEISKHETEETSREKSRKEEVSEKEKTDAESRSEESTIPKEEKPYIKKAPTVERKKEPKQSLEDEKFTTHKQEKEIDLGGTKAKKQKASKKQQKPTEVSIEIPDKASKGKETLIRLESPFVEIDLDEIKVFLVLPKQQFKPNSVRNIPQHLNYKLELNGKPQIISVKVSNDDQDTAKVEEKKIELEKPIKSFWVLFPDEIQGKTYSYNHNNENLYAFVAIGSNLGRMYYLYDKDGNINPLPNRMVWLLLHEDFKLKIESNYLTEETWIWEKYRQFRINLKEMNELVIKNTKTSKEYKLSCEPTFLIEGQVIEDDFKDQMPLLIGEALEIKAPRENPYGWTVWIQNKIAGYRIITENWSGVKPLSLKLPDDLPCEYGEFQVDICQQDTRIPDETLFFRWLPFIELNYPKELIIPNPRQGHKSEFIKVKVSGEGWALNYGADRKVEPIVSNSCQIELRPEEDTVRFSITKKGKPETDTKFQITMPRLKWKTPKHEDWNGKFQNIKSDELIYGESFYLLVCTNDFNNRYDLSSILETNGQRLQEGKFIRQGINYNLELNQFYDTIKRNKNVLSLKIEIRRTKDYKLLGTPEILYFDAKRVIQKPSPSKIVSYDLINTLFLQKVCFILRRIKAIYPKEKLACKEALQLYYQEIKTEKRTKRDISMYKRAFVIRSLALIKFIVYTCGDKTTIRGQKKWKKRMALLQQTYPEEFKNALDSLIRGDKHTH